MKNPIIILGVVFVLSQNTFGQFGWAVRPVVTSNHLAEVYFHNPYEGWIVGTGGIILRTTNWGTNWFTQPSGTSSDLLSVSFINSGTGYSVGSTGTVIKTTNTGSSWFPQTSGTSNRLNSVSFYPSPYGYAVGYNGTIISTTNSGINWMTRNSGVNLNLYSVYSPNAFWAWAVGAIGVIVRTTDDGESWVIQDAGTTSDLYEVFFIDYNTGWAVGTGEKILKTTNSGANWVSLSSGTNYAYRSVHFENNMVGWITGSPGLIKKTTNGGLNWTQQNSKTTEWLNSIFFCDTLIGWAVGNNGTILLTVTGGSIPAPPVLLYPPNGITNIPTTTNFQWLPVIQAQKFRFQISANAGFTPPLTVDTVVITAYQAPPGILNNSTQYYWRVNAIHIPDTTAWSVVWNFTTVPSPPAAPVLIAPPNNSTGVSLTPLLDWNDVPSAQSYRIQLSTNSGFSPAVLDTPGVVPSEFTVPAGLLSNNTLYYWRVNASNTGGTGPWSVTWVFTTTIVGQGYNKTEIPKEFKLYQNYPNPFNPKTTIIFDVPKTAHVRITAYNILGQEMGKIVDEQLNPASYKLMYYPEHYSSGVYYILMQAGEYLEIKKMVLIK